MRLISVRFGNVLASNGSVVPKFKAQIEAGGPVTVTHPDMVRYFMTIREACDLVITAATHALAPVRPDVSVYVLNMGQPVKIVDLAERMIRLSGLEPGLDIEITFTGMRPGERLNEILFASEEPTVEIGLAGIMAARPNEPPMATLRKWLAALEEAIARDDRATIKAVLKEAVPEFGATQPAEEPRRRRCCRRPETPRPFGSVSCPDLKDPPRKAQEERRIDRRRIEMLAARAQALEIAANGHAGAARADAADLEVDEHARQVADAEIVAAPARAACSRSRPW